MNSYSHPFLQQMLLKETTLSDPAPAEPTCEFYRNGFCRECSCEECNRTGMVVSHSFPPRAHECHCRALGRYRRILQRSGLEELAARYTFEQYDTSEPWQARVREMALEYLSQGYAEKRWFYLCGQSGSGKTHICTALCSELAKSGKDVLYSCWVKDSQQLKASVTDREEYSARLRPFLEREVLYLDDFMKFTPTEADLRLAMEVIGHRYCESKVTILSSERSLEYLRSRDEALAGRIAERAGRFRLALSGIEKNWRFKEEKSAS